AQCAAAAILLAAFLLSTARVQYARYPTSASLSTPVPQSVKSGAREWSARAAFQIARPPRRAERIATPPQTRRVRRQQCGYLYSFRASGKVMQCFAFQGHGF